jgi:gliding motility-associated-like protein
LDTVLLNPDQIILNDTMYLENHYWVIELSATGGTPDYTYTWSNGDNTSTVQGLLSGEYWVTVTDANGCTVENFYKVDIPLVIPSVITPNGDGKNDKFRITNISAYEKVTINVFNRWGDVIFSYSGTGAGYEDSSEQWDGTYNGNEAPLGSYVYVIELNDKEESYTGTVTIVR